MNSTTVYKIKLETTQTGIQKGCPNTTFDLEKATKTSTWFSVIRVHILHDKTILLFESILYPVL